MLKTNGHLTGSCAGVPSGYERNDYALRKDK
jgi:hypothetical protein